MRRAQGFEPIKQFAHKPKHRKSASTDQTLELTNWDGLSNSKRSVDKFRAGWQGFLVYSKLVYDPKPRLRKAGICA